VDVLGRKLIWASALAPQFDVTLPIAFAAGASPAEALLLDAAGQPSVRIAAESVGGWGNHLTIAVSHSSAAATRSRAIAAQTAAATWVESVAGFGPHDLVKVLQDQVPTPLVAYHTVAAIDAAAKRIVWDAPLEPGFSLTDPLSLETIEFALSISERGVPREVFAKLSLLPGHARYVETILAKSRLVRAEDLHSPSNLAERLPSPGVARLHGGRDGTAALRPEDFTAALTTLAEQHGFSAIAIPDILMQPAPAASYAPLPPPTPNPCLPCSISPTPAPPAVPALVEAIPGFSREEIARVQQALVNHCELSKRRIALLDPPPVDIAEIQVWRQLFDSKYAALYFPWLLVYDPLQPRGAVTRPVPPSGHVAGIFARTDLTIGVHQAPANQPVSWAADLTVPVTAGHQGVLNPAGINCFRSFPGRGLFLYGARTVSSAPAWIYVNVRRLMMMIEEAIEDATQWAVFEPNDFQVRQTLKRAINGFLEPLWKRGALRGAQAADAFFVKCDESNNPPSLAATGRLIAEVGVAPARPAEFVVFQLGRAGDTLEATE
jgi:hypothetical protein